MALDQTPVSTKTLKGYTFTIEFHDKKSYAVFRDSRRGYCEVAKLLIPEPLRNDPAALDGLFVKVHRLILQNYTQQHKNELYGITLLPGAILSPLEITQGVGLTRSLGRASRDDAPKAREVRRKLKERRERELPTRAKPRRLS